MSLFVEDGFGSDAVATHFEGFAHCASCSKEPQDRRPLAQSVFQESVRAQHRRSSCSPDFGKRWGGLHKTAEGGGPQMRDGSKTISRPTHRRIVSQHCYQSRPYCGGHIAWGSDVAGDLQSSVYSKETSHRVATEYDANTPPSSAFPSLCEGSFLSCVCIDVGFGLQREGLASQPIDEICDSVRQ